MSARIAARLVVLSAVAGVTLTGCGTTSSPAASGSGTTAAPTTVPRVVTSPTTTSPTSTVSATRVAATPSTKPTVSVPSPTSRNVGHDIQAVQVKKVTTSGQNVAVSGVVVVSGLPAVEGYTATKEPITLRLSATARLLVLDDGAPNRWVSKPMTDLARLVPASGLFRVEGTWAAPTGLTELYTP